MPFTFLTAEWRKLIMAQYEIAPATLTPLLPRGLELDSFHGRHFVSLVGFLFDRVRILGVPVPLHTRFEEVNLRFYVRRPMPDGSYRRGVIFISEIVPRAAITLVARTLYGEAYSTAPMRHRWQRSAVLQEITYEWRHARLWQSIAVRAGLETSAIHHGSMEAFITEHYWGYTARRGGGSSEYAVEHARWRVYPIHAHRIVADCAGLYGPDFADLADRTPDHVLLAEGAPVRIRWGGRIA
jgi:uncharacterized protein YqjF (DUF2071 family)